MRRHRAILTILLAATCALLSPASVAAHQRPIPLEQWGPFLPETVPCLRTLSRVGPKCFDAALRILDQCERAKLLGEVCDAAAIEERLAEETARIRTAILDRCTPGQLTELQYPGGVLDAQADHSNACREQAAATMAMTYAPAANGADGPIPPDVSACLTATSVYGRKVLRLIIRRKAKVMDRIGARLLSGSEKTAWMNRIGRNLASGESRWAAGLLRVCPAFEEIYGRSPVGFVRTLKDRADCVLTATHGNDSLICIPQRCPNGIVEPGEECDDGNGDDTDVCGNDCRAR